MMKLLQNRVAANRLLATGVLLAAKPAHASTTFSVTNPNDSGAGGSLRQAILDANAASGADTINFNIPGDGVRTSAPNNTIGGTTAGARNVISAIDEGVVII